MGCRATDDDDDDDDDDVVILNSWEMTSQHFEDW
jgi:hypothetical protein